MGLLQLSPLAFNVKCSGGSSSPYHTPGLGSLTWGLRALTPVGQPLQYNYSPICGSPTQQVWDLITSQVCPSSPSCRGSIFMFLVVEDLFWWVLVFFLDGCSADGCDFGVLVRGGELRVFLLCRLGCSSPPPFQFLLLKSAFPPVFLEISPPMPCLSKLFTSLWFS